MKRDIRVEPEAEEELFSAAAWYEEEREGLGFQLLDEAAEAYARIENGEHGTPIRGTRARRIPLVRFPLWIVFVERERDAIVVAYAHERRRPGYWRHRIP